MSEHECIPVEPARGETGEGARRIVAPDLIAGYLQDASLRRGHAEVLFRPDREADVAAIVAAAQREGLPLTVVAGQTSTTASSVPEGGGVVSVERLNRLVAIDVETRRARCEPGLGLAALQRAVEAHGLFYPPDPTSREDCTVGGTVACNASGARSHRFGPTRNWIRGLRVVLPCGEVIALERGRHRVRQADGLEIEHSTTCALEHGGRQRVPIPSFAFEPGVKNATGLFGGREVDPIDLFIGSEGTLGVVTEVEVDLIAMPGGCLDLFVCVETEEPGLALVERARTLGREEALVQPASLEWFDRASLDLVGDDAAAIAVPPNARAALHIEQFCENPGAANDPALLGAWFDLFAAVGIDVEDESGIRVASTDRAREALRRARHAVPVCVNERAARNGMPKLGTDLAVCDERLRDVMALYQRARSLPLELLSPARREVLAGEGVPSHVASATFGHIGDNHLHMNFLPTNAAERALAEALRDELTERVIGWGGSPSAEHGIGKLKHAALRQRVGDGAYEEMRATRLAFDPREILGRGNLFAFE